ncbi:nucleotidyltransferase family protein [Parafilimonas terrae]|uniref:Nucleotidyltransferase domain-containing protein n=1 Tax=Parafilimonas terrae TaxID=1465490 RepID=A0A1I5R3B6_9BACT|nr:nucleotidyltransferase domain-containing protein [Parafilimonas terrae]SFP52827.1 Nucleotidyltransferase domain-containing protein [Parafilimonas terrae]
MIYDQRKDYRYFTKTEACNAKKYGLSEIALFGSFSRDKQTANSDIDLLVDFDTTPGLSYLDMLYNFDKLFEREVQVITKRAKAKVFEGY